MVAIGGGRRWGGVGGVGVAGQRRLRRRVARLENGCRFGRHSRDSQKFFQFVIFIGNVEIFIIL